MMVPDRIQVTKDYDLVFDDLIRSTNHADSTTILPKRAHYEEHIEQPSISTTMHKMLSASMRLLNCSPRM